MGERARARERGQRITNERVVWKLRFLVLKFSGLLILTTSLPMSLICLHSRAAPLRGSPGVELCLCHYVRLHEICGT
jgi:hypothetical protein